MIPVTDLRAGTTFQINGVPYMVLKYTHTKMGRGTANVRVEARNLKTGAVEGKTFTSNARVEDAPTTKRKMQYLYSSEGTSTFMDPVNFEQVEIGGKVLGEQVKYTKEGEMVNILFFGENPLSLEPAPKVNLKVIQTAPGVRGNSATNIWKPATLENGLSVKVPLFINIGDKVRVDTRTGEYVERVKVSS